jgi:hypothetical protein
LKKLIAIVAAGELVEPGLLLVHVAELPHVILAVVDYTPNAMALAHMDKSRSDVHYFVSICMLEFGAADLHIWNLLVHLNENLKHDLFDVRSVLGELPIDALAGEIHTSEEPAAIIFFGLSDLDNQILCGVNYH